MIILSNNKSNRAVSTSELFYRYLSIEDLPAFFGYNFENTFLLSFGQSQILKTLQSSISNLNDRPVFATDSLIEFESIMRSQISQHNKLLFLCERNCPSLYECVSYLELFSSDWYWVDGRSVPLRKPDCLTTKVSHDLRAMQDAQRSDVTIFGIIGAWYESDVIFATVKNAFAQGCSKVFLVDNNSPDATVSEALAAGATLARNFCTLDYDENLRISIMNDVVNDISEQSGLDRLWWLWLDADEFPRGPRGLTILEYLTSIDPRYRVVGTTYINHFPTSKPGYVTKHHPIDFQPNCNLYFSHNPVSQCQMNHWKHPLQRYDRHEQKIFSHAGFHRVQCKTIVFEPPLPIITHHFPFREESFTRNRLEALCSPVSNDSASGSHHSRNAANDLRLGGVSGITNRLHALDRVYSGLWKGVPNLAGIEKPIHWFNFVAESDQFIKKWY